MEEFTSDALRTVQQAADELSMEIDMNPEVHKNNEVLQELENETAAACADSIINQPETVGSVISGSVLESELLTEISESLYESQSAPLSEKDTSDGPKIGLQSELQKMPDSASDIIDSIVKCVTEPVEENENRMDTSDSISENISTDSVPLTKDLSEENVTGTLEVSEIQNAISSEKVPDTTLNNPVETAKQAVNISEVSNLESSVSQELDEKLEDSTSLKVTESLSEIPSESFPELEPEAEKNAESANNVNTNTIKNVVENADKIDKDSEHRKGIDVSENNENAESTPTEDNDKIIEETVATQSVSRNDDDISDQNKTNEKNKEKYAATSAVPEAGLYSSLESEKNNDIDKSTNSVLNREKEKPEGERENTEFVQVNTENEKESENEKDEEMNNRRIMEDDPIASDAFESTSGELHEGADEELCIIPDTQREISQAERDAASSIPPLRDLIEASASSQTDDSSEPMVSDQSPGSPTIVYKYEKEDLQICNECKLKRKVKYYYTTTEGGTNFLCDDNCLNDFKISQQDKVALNWEEGSLRVKNFSGVSKEPPSLSFIRKCAACKKITDDIENNLTWEIMDFCNEFCITKYQKETGSHCSSCQGEVKSNCLGKYCVRFGNDIRQFCTSGCLEKYKKGLKVCSYCQRDMSGGTAGFVAPVGDKGQIKDFCTELCMEKYDVMTNNRPPKVVPGTICSVCKGVKPITIEFELDGCPNYFCGEPCFVAFSFVNNISPGKCAMCRRHFPKSTLEKYTMYYDNVQHSFCSNSCENIYIVAHRKIVPCSWCKVKKYNFDMIRRYSKTGPMINMCSVNCLSLYRISLDTVNSRHSCCNFCQKVAQPMYYLTMSDSTTRNFCSYNCVLTFQNQYPQQPFSVNNLGESSFPVPTGAPKKSKTFPDSDSPGPMGDVSQLPVISSVQSLASTNGNLGSPQALPPTLSPIQTINTRSTRSKSTTNPPIMNSSPQVINSFSEIPFQVQIKQHFIVRPAPMPEQKNVGTMCYTKKANKSTMMKPIMVDEEVQTEEREAKKILIPVPVPIYVPTPMHMFSVPTPVPVPIPVPIPIPIFIPTTRNSAAGIMKEIKKIQVKIPTDPYEAELLMMAEMVAEEKKEDLTDSESDVDDTGGPEDSYSPEPVDANNTFGDDMLQMALKMATELDEPAVDLEGALTANTITAPQGGEPHGQEENVDDPQPMHHHMMERSPSVRGRKRGMRQPRGGAKRGRRMSHQQVDIPLMQHHQVQQAPPPPEPTEKPDANMCLKYTFGVNAWKQWVTTKNTELEKSSRRVKLFKTEILQLTADELNYSLCLFVKEVRKPNGAEYAPDTIYYLCLGIQQYLFENGRIENIFCDPYYEKFTDCLDEVAKKFSVLYNDSHYIVTRVEEEHLWESKQLGAHSPHVLLSTLMFFNTKHFNLTSVDEHMQLSFSHIMKHWKRNPNQPGASKVPGSRNVLLRFYPPQSAIQNNARKKKVYEQQENEENPLRCPVKLYEFYLSKCPESVKTRNDVFYLQPERSCVPDSPVWYSTMPLPKEALEKMLHRVKMVKEINVALLTS